MAHRWYWLAQGLLLVLAALCAWTAYERSALFFSDETATAPPAVTVKPEAAAPRRAGVRLVEAAVTRTVAVLARPADGADAPLFVSLLELTLTQQPGVTLVDRERIEAVLREQQLEAVFQPEGGGSRIRLGRLLAADALVLLQPDPADPETLEFTVSETGLGLRLFRHRIPATPERPEEAVAAAAEFVAAALARLEQPIYEIIAVPPFASEDLTREHDPLRHTYAGFLEQMLLADPGVVLVELAEAQAIARELAIDGHAGGIARPMPLYVEGAFRHDAAGRVRVTIRAHRGGGPLLERQADGLSGPEVMAFCRSVTGEMLDHVAGRAVAPVDPAAEARVLARRARLLLRLGDTEQAVRSLAVASLLQPDAAEYRKLTLRAVRDQLHQHRYESPLAETRAGRAVLAEKAHAAWELTSGHVWYYLDHVLCQQGPRVDELRRELRRPLRDFTSTLSAYRPVTLEGQGTLWPGIDRIAAQAWSTARHAAERGVLTNDDLEDLLSLVAGNGPQGRMTKLELTRQTVALIDLAAWRDSPRLNVAWATRRAMAPLGLTHSALHNVVVDLPEPDHHPLVARTIEWERLNIEEYLARRAEPQESQGVPHAQATAQSVRAMDFTIQAVDPATGRRRAVKPWGWIRAGAGVDALWTQEELFLMTEPGKAEPVYHVNRPMEPRHPMHVGEGIGEACFDGRYVWAPVVHERAELVLVEPRTGKVRRFTSEDGLPPMDRGGTAAPLGPGRILLIGAFSVDQPLRTWVATVSYRPGQPLQIDQWYEAKEATNSPGFGNGRAFWPRRAQVVTRPGADGRQWVAVEQRRSPTLNGGGVMIFEPQRRHAAYLADPLPHTLFSAAGDGESLYFVDQYMLLRLRPPLMELEPLRPYRTDQHWYALSTISDEGFFLIDSLGCLWFTPDPTAQPWRIDPTFSLLKHWNYRSPFGFTRMLFTAHHGLVVINEEGACVRLERPIAPPRPAHPEALPKTVVPVGDGLCMAYPGRWTWEEARVLAAELGGELFTARSEDELNIARGLRILIGERKHPSYWTAMNHLPAPVTPDLGTPADHRIMLHMQRGWMAEPTEERHGLIVRWPRPEADRSLPPDTSVVFTNAAGISFVLIPAGEFVMGSPAGEPGRRGDEVQHTVRIEHPFLMSVTEVTHSQFHSATGWVWGGPGDANRPALISGSHGRILIQSLQKLDGRRYRLPTEAEWEYAARAGSTTAYPGGDNVADLRRVGWFAEPGQPPPSQPYSVAQCEPNAWGLYDMYGNVWEWCSTGYHAYGTPAPPAVFDLLAPHPPPVMRGGSWLSPPELCRAAYRRAGPSGYAAGARLVLDLIPENDLPDMGLKPGDRK